MPTYEYMCEACGKKFSKAMSFAEHEKAPRPRCPKCKRSEKVTQRVSGFQAVTSKKT